MSAKFSQKAMRTACSRCNYCSGRLVYAAATVSIQAKFTLMESICACMSTCTALVPDHLITGCDSSKVLKEYMKNCNSKDGGTRV